MDMQYRSNLPMVEVHHGSDQYNEKLVAKQAKAKITMAENPNNCYLYTRVRRFFMNRIWTAKLLSGIKELS